MASHSVLLAEITLAATTMAQTTDWRDGIDNLLERLGGSADVSRVYLFEVEVTKDGVLTHGCFHDWAAHGLDRLAKSARYKREIIENYDPIFDSWIESRRRGQLIKGHTRELKGVLREDFDYQKIKSFMSMPILVNGVWWGHLGFDDCIREREWSIDEVHLLQTTAALIGASATREEAAQKYHRNERLRAAMADVALDAIIVIDGDGIARDFNPAAEAIFGRSRSDVLGRKISDLIVPEKLRPGHERGFKAATKDRQLRLPAVRREMSALRVDGTEFPIELALVQVDQGHEILYAGFIRDPTDRKLAEVRIREVERERSNLARFFSPQLVDHMISIETPLSSDRYQAASVLFVDMIGFTTFCAENMPRTVIDLLRELLSILSQQVFANEGTIDKFLGDGLMAVFGSPKAGPFDCTNAIRCAFSMQRAVAEWNRRAGRLDDEAIRIAIGIHSGHVIIGDIGSEHRLEFAVLGDTVNIASRVEGKCRSLGATILVTSEVMAALEAEGGSEVAKDFEDLGEQHLRGRSSSVHLHGVKRSLASTKLNELGPPIP
ncbi:adenylate/guanylate cyclase domain-containing protein [Rhizobium sp. PL01]|uniref:adenylate/guanylate cyclase domain-containing protein n=1 Tax=Rhizobium sp. PL01 TaxID=3085631 RepID=UPI0029827952|nr:adenylate/guanylate cyclase domain-containing protein [Rhizobium sp. PL01]MDW5316804.1 adenylate/guanylate cyclase domain-containing protein [Rhizobium sp. PL01]